MSVSRISTEAVSICGIRRRKSPLFSSSIAEAGDRTATCSWDSCKKSRHSLSSWATRSSPSALINPKNWLRPRTNRPPPTPWFPTVTRPGSRGSASLIVWMIRLSIPTRISTRSTWKKIPAPSTISYRRPLYLLSVEKARSFSSTSILITKCDCTRRFFWRRPRPMPRNDPEGTAPDLKWLLAGITHMIRGGSRCLSRSRRVTQNNGVRILESVCRSCWCYDVALNLRGQIPSARCRASGTSCSPRRAIHTRSERSGDDIVGVATYGTMIEGIIFRIRRELSRLGFGYLLTNLAEQIDESSSRIARDFITPGQHEPQFGRVWFRRLLAERPRSANHNRSVNDHTPEPAWRHIIKTHSFKNFGGGVLLRLPPAMILIPIFPKRSEQFMLALIRQLTVFTWAT